jgi:adenylosuccinate lyase
MIDRYEASEIASIWSEENKYRKWLEVELAITETWAEMGEAPAASLKNIREKAALEKLYPLSELLSGIEGIFARFASGK